MLNQYRSLSWLIVVCCLLLSVACGGSDDNGNPGDTNKPQDTSQTQDTTQSQDTTQTQDLTGTGLKWFHSCGDPVCNPTPQPTGDPLCSTEKVGDPCATENQRCDANLGCGAALVCAKTQPTNCPKSQRKYKKDIQYLSSAETKRLHDGLLSVRLATYRYKFAPKSPRRLGFIIEDRPPSVSVHPNGRQVDLYGYSSMTVAAIQTQARQLKALKQEITELKRQLKLLLKRQDCNPRR